MIYFLAAKINIELLPAPISAIPHILHLKDSRYTTVIFQTELLVGDCVLVNNPTKHIN